MKTLFAQTFTAFLLSLSLLLLVVISLFLFGIRRSIQDWNVYRDRSLQGVIVPQLQRLYRRDNELTNDTVEAALTQFLTDNHYVYVLDPDREPLFMYSRGENIMLEGEEAIERVLVNLERSREMQRAVFDGEQLIAYISSGTTGFRSDVANLRFLRSMFTTVGIGVTVSLVVALVAAFVFSSYVSNQARGLASGLRRLASGERHVSFPRRSSRELRTIAASAETLQSRLEQEEQLRRQWAEDVAHDLRTPIAALKTQFEGMLEGYIKPDSKRLEALFSELLRLEGLVNDLRELNRMESPEMTIEPKEIDADEFLCEIAGTFELISTQRSIQFVTNNALDTFVADKRLLARGVGNVIQNAFQHVESGGWVSLDVYPRDGYTVFEVSNAGYVDPEEIPRLFDRLYRGRGGSKRHGSGLGLSITKAIVELHGGTVQMQQQDHTTRVLLQIPRTPPAGGKAAPADARYVVVDRR